MDFFFYYVLLFTTIVDFIFLSVFHLNEFPNETLLIRFSKKYFYALMIKKNK